VEPLELLYEPVGLPAFDLPARLAALYPGTFGLPDDCVYSNFVETIDGVVALPGVPRSNRLIADENEADLFVMALLRACADAVVIGAGTLRASPANLWTGEAAFPSLAEELAELRQSLGMRARPDVVVLSRTGAVEPPEAIADRLLVRADLDAAIEELRESGCGRILCEGGPTVLGSLLAADLVDELFLTMSPLLAGRGLSLVGGADLLPHRRRTASLAGVRRDGDHLFLRYTLRATSSRRGGDGV
jgi:riboflavin biosynthesis pyrimidine reductase